MVKIARLDDAFLEVFLTASKLSRRSITAAKRKEKEKKERKTNLICAHARANLSQNAMLVSRRESCRAHVANVFLTRTSSSFSRTSMDFSSLAKIDSLKLTETHC